MPVTTLSQLFSRRRRCGRMASVLRLALILAAFFSSSADTHAGAPPEGRAGRSEAPAQTERNTQAKPALWIIPHTHWEGAVFKTREEYLEIGLPHILTALHLLKADRKSTRLNSSHGYISYAVFCLKKKKKITKKLTN